MTSEAGLNPEQQHLDASTNSLVAESCRSDILELLWNCHLQTATQMLDTLLIDKRESSAIFLLIFLRT
jgi:hypothetical protein